MNYPDLYDPPDPRSQDEVDANAGTGCAECAGPEGARRKFANGFSMIFYINLVFDMHN